MEKIEKPEIFISKFKNIHIFINCVIACNCVIIFGVIEKNQEMLYHAFIQTAIFIVFAQIPSYLTGVMWWVDFAWPLVLTTIPIYSYFHSLGTLKAKLICGCYFFQGLRMVLGSTKAITSGKWNYKNDLPRYQYQKILHEHHNGVGTWGTIHMQKEIYMQAIANYSCLIVPVFIVCNDKVDI
jgi:steroid 5-alpha reductase family enzyme